MCEGGYKSVNLFIDTCFFLKILCERKDNCNLLPTVLGLYWGHYTKISFILTIILRDKYSYSHKRSESEVQIN